MFNQTFTQLSGVDPVLEGTQTSGDLFALYLNFATMVLVSLATAYNHKELPCNSNLSRLYWQCNISYQSGLNFPSPNRQFAKGGFNGELCMQSIAKKRNRELSSNLPWSFLCQKEHRIGLMNILAAGAVLSPVKNGKNNAPAWSPQKFCFPFLTASSIICVFLRTFLNLQYHTEDMKNEKKNQVINVFSLSLCRIHHWAALKGNQVSAMSQSVA